MDLFSKPADFDDLQDLFFDEDTLVFVALSGGGARAAMLAQHTLTLLERKYNRFRVQSPNKPPLIRAIHAISSVSGGSLFAYRIARTKTLVDDTQKHADNTQEHADNISDWHWFCYPRNLGQIEENLFGCLESDPLLPIAPTKLSKLGLSSALDYFHPLRFFIPPLVSLFTDQAYVSNLARTLHNTTGIITGYEKWTGLWDLLRFAADPSSFKLSYVSQRPLFFFNATSLETGLPFAFTQRIIHLPIKNPVLTKTARLDLAFMANIQSEDETETERLYRLRKPLGGTTTLEELNSSPADTPLAFAALASAAFPIGLEPLTLTKYGYDPVNQVVYESPERMSVSDGGLYDNSGMSTLGELFESIVKSDTKRNKKTRNTLAS